jgi:hypothetical protein
MTSKYSSLPVSISPKCLAVKVCSVIFPYWSLLSKNILSLKSIFYPLGTSLTLLGDIILLSDLKKKSIEMTETPSTITRAGMIISMSTLFLL